MKLELKHLSAYLPYGLRVRHFEWGNWELDGLDVMLNEVKLIGEKSQDQGWELIGNIKPILRPLSDLNENIPFANAEYHWAALISCSSQEMDGYINDVNNGVFDYEDLKYWQIERLFENHIDVFGLIESGLAIDINTIKE